jgi:hypothetical protein
VKQIHFTKRNINLRKKWRKFFFQYFHQTDTKMKLFPPVDKKDLPQKVDFGFVMSNRLGRVFDQ